MYKICFSSIYIDFVFLKISSKKCNTRFGKTGKLAPRYTGLFEITQRIGPVTYRLSLPASLEHIHEVCHVFMLRKYEPDPTNVLDIPDVQIHDQMSYEEITIQILVVLWDHHGIEEATWELELEMLARYSRLFDSGGTLI